MKKLFFSFFLTSFLIWSSFFFPDLAFAGSCRCLNTNIIDPNSAQINVCNYTSGVNTPAECESHNNTSDSNWTYSECKYYAANNCSCQISGLYSVPKTCTIDANCNVGTGTATCCDNTCYLDQAALSAYNSGQTGAADWQKGIKITKPILSIAIPGVEFSNPANELDSEGNVAIPFLAEYLKGVYQFAMIAGSMAAVIVIILNGFRITMSAGGPEKNKGIQNIVKAITGLFILWSSYALFNTINPDLTQINTLKVRYIAPVPNIDIVNDPLTTGVQTTGFNSVVNFKQNDSRWGGLVYGYIDKICDPVADKAETAGASTACCTSIQAAGCGPTALAMVLATMNQKVTPVETAKFMGTEGNGRICNQGTNMNVTVSKLDSSPWSGFTSLYLQKENVVEYVKNRKPVIMLCKNCTGYRPDGTTRSYGGHYLVLTGYDENTNKIYVNDPAGTNVTGIATMTESQLDNNAGFWYIFKKQ